MPEHRLSTLDSGVRVVSEPMPGVRSVALGIMVGVGSRYETVEQAGLSHFLEHLLFKGTDRFSSTEIDQFFDGIGAEVNAGTDKESTVVYARFLDKNLDRAFDVMADMVLRSTFEDIDSERQVVIEEIAMYEDEPSDKVHDVLATGVFGDSPLGRPIIGNAKVVGGVPIPEIIDYRDHHYNAGNIVVAAAGAVDHDRLVGLVESAGFGGSPAPAELETADLVAPSLCFYQKKTEQFHIALGAPGIARDDDRRFALRLLNTILGGSTSSRLFQEVREKRGLAYSVYSYAGHYRDTGQLGVYVGTRPERAAEAMQVIGEQLSLLATDPASEDELRRAKENLKGRTALARESSSGRMNAIGNSILFDIPILSLEEIEAKIDQVTLDDLRSIAADCYRLERFSAAAVGEDEEIFRKALEPVSPQLVAAA